MAISLGILTQHFQTHPNADNKQLIRPSGSVWLRSPKNGTLEVTQHSTHCMHGFSGVPTSILQAGLASPRTPLHHDLSASTLRKRFDALTCSPKMFKVHSKKSGKHGQHGCDVILGQDGSSQSQASDQVAMSMDWFKGNFTGNHRFYHQI
jgi:hypothetical protein